MHDDISVTPMAISGTCTAVSGALTVAQTNQAYQVISLIATIIGVLVTIATAIVIPSIQWYKKSKEDNKITPEELEQLREILEQYNKDHK